jgi:hypothetical protein
MNSLVEQRDRQVTVKVRRPWAVSVIGAVTFGVYVVIWYYLVNREMRDIGGANGDRELASSRPVRSVIAVTIGGLIVIPELVSYVGTVRRVQAVERVATGGNRAGWPLIGGLVGSAILGLAAYAHGVGSLLAWGGLPVLVISAGCLQARLNRVWELSGVATGGSVEASTVIAP